MNLAQCCIEQSWTRKKSQFFFLLKAFLSKNTGFFFNKRICFLQSTFTKKPRLESKEPLPRQPLGLG